MTASISAALDDLVAFPGQTADPDDRARRLVADLSAAVTTFNLRCAEVSGTPESGSLLYP